MWELMKLLARLKRCGLNGVDVALNFIYRHIQPCKERVTPGYEYVRGADMNQEAREHVDKGDCYARTQHFFKANTTLSNQG